MCYYTNGQDGWTDDTNEYTYKSDVILFYHHQPSSLVQEKRCLPRYATKPLLCSFVP